MKSTVTRVFSGYQTDIISSEGQIIIIMKSIQSGNTLQTVFTETRMPLTLQNVINTPHQLFITLQNIPKEQVRIVNQDTLILKTQVFFMYREYCIPLDKKDEATQVYQTPYQARTTENYKSLTFYTLKKNPLCLSYSSESQGVSQLKREKILSELNYNLSQENYDLQEEILCNSKRLEEVESKNSELYSSNIKLVEERDRLEEENKLLEREKNRLSHILLEGDVKSQVRTGSQIKEIEKVQPKEEQNERSLKLEMFDLENEAISLMEKIVRKQAQISNLSQERVKLGHQKLNLMKAIDELKTDIQEMTKKGYSPLISLENNSKKNIFKKD